MTYTIAISNQKGGVGKTILTINLGAALAHLGHRVLLVDLDPQGHLTEGVGLQTSYLADKDCLPYSALSDPQATTLQQLVKKPKTDRFFVIPSNYEMMLAEQMLFMARGRENRLRELL